MLLFHPSELNNVARLLVLRLFDRRFRLLVRQRTSSYLPKEDPESRSEYC